MFTHGFKTKFNMNVMYTVSKFFCIKKNIKQKSTNKFGPHVENYVFDLPVV